MESEAVSADLASNTFESVKSTLVFNIAKWPLGKLDKLNDNRSQSEF